MPTGYSYTMGGEYETVQENMSQVLLMLVLAIAFMYLIMVAQFQSLKSPFIILFTIPLAFTGGFIALLLCGMDVSIIAMFGFIMLSGIIVNNGIVLVDYINQLREEGMEKREAIITAGQTRMRPIIMTALTTILGLVFMAAGVGDGSEMMQPMAVVTIGGLIYGTLLTLIVIPCVYDVFHPAQKNRKNYFGKRRRLTGKTRNFQNYKNSYIRRKRGT
jgi:HAE1 family hydrophobic/amphiphilic exporter-1